MTEVGAVGVQEIGFICIIWVISAVGASKMDI